MKKFLRAFLVAFSLIPAATPMEHLLAACNDPVVVQLSEGWITLCNYEHAQQVMERISRSRSEFSEEDASRIRDAWNEKHSADEYLY